MYIIQAGWVILPEMKIAKQSSLVIDENKIVEVLPHDEARTKYPQASIINRSDCVISPGFVNAHMHLYGVLAHGIEPVVPVLSFESFLTDYWWPLVEDQLDATMISCACAYSAAELVNSGVTALCDVLEAPYAGYEGLLAQEKVLRSLGVRAILSTEACQRISGEMGWQLLEANARFVRTFKDDPLITGMICTHTAFTCDEQFLSKAVDLAVKEQASLQLHLNESEYESKWTQKAYGMRTCNWYDKIGVLSDKLLAAQAVQVDAQEIQLLAKHKVRTVHVPLSNCEVGGGISPVPALLDASVACSLGTDGYINNFFEVMRASFLIHKGVCCDPTIMSSRTVYRMATQSGSDALYPGKQYGRLQPNAAADFITINLAGLPTTVTEYNLFDQIILYRNPQDVQDVMVEGKFLKKDFTMQTTKPFGFLGRQAAIEAQRLWDKGRSVVAKNKETR
jgi:cytosine/adenosine deaminase-related metal-dependent hydrolase